MPGLRSWASGGFNHFVLDEELDHKALKALQDKDVDVIASLPLERLQSGTSEIRNWFATAGAVQHLEMEVFDYVPCYRSPAGTGVQWRLPSGYRRVEKRGRRGSIGEGRPQACCDVLLPPLGPIA